MGSSDPSYAEKQRRYWELYDEVSRHVDVEIRYGGTVCHIVPRENREIKVKRMSRLLFTRNWPICGKVGVVENWPMAPNRDIHSLCATCARVAHSHLQKLQEDSNDERAAGNQGNP